MRVEPFKATSAYVSSVTKQPTTGNEGVMTYTCEHCGYSYTRAIAKLQDTNNNNSGESQPVDTNPGDNNPGDNNPGDNNPEDNKPGAENRPNTEKPYIKSDSGKEGWDTIKAEADKYRSGDILVVEMNGSTAVPGDVLDEIKDRDISLAFDMGNGISWSVNGQSITADKTDDIDFSVKTETNTIPIDVIYSVIGERYSKQITLAYNGEFGFTAVLSINMGANNAGLYANLFYYNEKTGELEFICADEIAADGMAELTFTHASDYAVVVDKEPMDKTQDADNASTESPKTGADSIQTGADSTQTGAEAENAASNPWWIIVIGVMVIVVGLGVFLVAKKKSEDE